MVSSKLYRGAAPEVEGVLGPYLEIFLFGEGLFKIQINFLFHIIVQYTIIRKPIGY